MFVVCQMKPYGKYSKRLMLLTFPFVLTGIFIR